jgi:hypothetical protein
VFTATIAALALLAGTGASSATAPPVEAFTVRTFDGLELPARVARPEGRARKLLLFINGSTPSDESGYQAAIDHGYNAPHAAMTWAGHVCDLQGRRPVAVDWYRKALAAYNGVPVRQDQYGIVLDRAWIEARITEPFAGLPAKEAR